MGMIAGLLAAARDPRRALIATSLSGIAAAGGFAAMVPHLSGCGCTAVGWSEGLSVTVERTGSSFPAGKYRFSIVADGVPLALDFDPSADRSFERCTTPYCDASTQAILGRTLNLHLIYGVTPDGELVNMTVQVWYTNHDNNAGGPQEMSLRITRDGREIANDTFEPSYDVDSINGWGCGEATTASANIAIAP